MLTRALSSVLRSVASGGTKGIADGDMEDALVQLTLACTRAVKEG
ncbi:MAG: hypothetical protein WDO12_02975 [Pseudomonadota bacterium]